MYCTLCAFGSLIVDYLTRFEECKKSCSNLSILLFQIKVSGQGFKSKQKWKNVNFASFDHAFFMAPPLAAVGN